MRLRNAILLLGVLGIFFAFACPLAPTPTVICKVFLLVLFVLVLTIMTRHGVVLTKVVAEARLLPVPAECPSPQLCSSVLLC